MIKTMANRQCVPVTCSGCIQLGLYRNERSNKIFYAAANDQARNRVKATEVWIDDNGYIFAKIGDIK